MSAGEQSLLGIRNLAILHQYRGVLLLLLAGAIVAAISISLNDIPDYKGLVNAAHHLRDNCGGLQRCCLPWPHLRQFSRPQAAYRPDDRQARHLFVPEEPAQSVPHAETGELPSLRICVDKELEATIRSIYAIDLLGSIIGQQNEAI